MRYLLDPTLKGYFSILTSYVSLDSTEKYIYNNLSHIRKAFKKANSDSVQDALWEYYNELGENSNSYLMYHLISIDEDVRFLHEEKKLSIAGSVFDFSDELLFKVILKDILSNAYEAPLQVANILAVTDNWRNV